MLAMSDELDHDNLFWDVEQSWEFPNLASEENSGKKSGNSSGSQAAKDAEEPPPATTKGKKRTATARKDLDGCDQLEKQGKMDGGDQSDDHELHIWTERERRKKMRSMFENLHSLLPHLAPKADKSTIVDEAVNYIKKLEQTLNTLQQQKLDKLHGIIITNNNNNPMMINYNNPSLITQQKLTIQTREAFLAEQGSTSNSPNSLFLSPNNYELPAIFKTWTSPNVILNICGKDAQISVCSVKKVGLMTKICFVMEKNKLELVSAHVSSDRYRCMYMIHARHASGGLDQFQQAFPVEEIYKQAAAEIMLWVNS